MRLVLSLLTILLIIMFAMFCYCNTATAYTFLPDADAVANQWKRSHFGSTENLLTNSMDEIRSQLDLSSASDRKSASHPKSLLYQHAVFRMFDGDHSGINHSLFINDYWGDYGIKRQPRPEADFSFSSGWYGRNNGWFFWTITFFSKLPMNEHWAMVFEERLELLMKTFADYFYDPGNDDSNPSPVPIPTPLLLLASGLVGFVGLQRISRR